VISNVVQTPGAKSLNWGEGAAGEDDFIGEAYVTFKSDTSGSDSEDGGLGHQRAAITHDIASHLAHQLSWVHN
jgi:hypothetical protein